ncbi:MAG: xanthine dehydrogenase family protein molybdopterin-binding subunit [Chloroflexi bacterium]|nr:xanthine dehydrogenase family protein molybdopterin-binding subunit [Chloroflexota bacterium]
MIRHLNWAGKPANRVDGPAKTTGDAKYAADYRVPGQLVTRALRSPIPHGNIVRLNTAPALQVPGVRAVITSDDFVEHGRFGFPIADNFILAWQKVRYVGEGIAIVAADDAEAAEAGVRAIELDLQELPVVADMFEAMQPGAPLIPDVPTEGGQQQPNLCMTQIVRNGDPEPILAASPIQLDQTYATPFQEHAYLEPEAVLSIPNPDGSVVIYACDQSPFNNRGIAAAVLGLAPEKVRVIQAIVGGSFGGKDEVVYQMSAQTAKLALLTGKPVRMVFSREESIIVSYKRDASRIRIRLGANKDGQLQAAKVEAWLDGGAYSAETVLTAWRAAMHLAGAYRYEAVHADAHVVYTNNNYSSAFRGFGNTEAVACIEQAIDELAGQVGVDPLDYRLKNILHKGDLTMTGNPLQQEVGLQACLEWVRQKSDWDRKRCEFPAHSRGARYRKGIGVACYFHGMSLGGEGADFATTTLAIEKDGTVTLTNGLTDYGTGSRTVFTLIAAEVLGARPERIRVLLADTETAVDSGPTVASRASVVGGNATRVAADKLAQLLNWAAADLLKCAPEQIVRDQEMFIGADEEPVGFDAVAAHARKMGFVLSAHGKWQMPTIHWDFEKGAGVPYVGYTFGAQVVEVTVNTGTGKVQADRIWAAHDIGKVLFPEGAYGQLYGGIAQGLGYGLMEEVEINHGYIHNVNFDDYIIPTAMDVPAIEATFVEAPFALGPYGAKNVAEPSMLGVAPALANAVCHATGKRIRELPLTPERILLGRALVNDDGGANSRQWLGYGGDGMRKVRITQTA